MRQRVVKEIESRFPGNAKLFTLESDQDAMLILRHIGSQKQRSIFFKDNRPHMMAEKVEFEEKVGWRYSYGGVFHKISSVWCLYIVVPFTCTGADFV